MKDYKKFVVWQKSHQLTLDVYRCTAEYPKEEMFGPVSQMRRSSSSVPTNIAEGCGRNSEKDFCRFLIISFGSANELEYQVMLSTDLRFVQTKDSKALPSQIVEVKKMLSSLIKKIELSAKR
ncbi:MAG TPA: four helix bundle protein [Flavobacterium sp.]|jgi:four helix bundle protein